MSSVSMAMYSRIKVALKLAPEALIGRKLRVYWPEDDGWFLGTVVQYDAHMGQHKVYLEASLQLLCAACNKEPAVMHQSSQFGVLLMSIRQSHK